MRQGDLRLARSFLIFLVLGPLVSACGDSGMTAPEPPAPEPPAPEPNQAPTAEITSPSEGAEFVQGDSIRFWGEANDPEDGSLSGSSLTWETAGGEQIGTGREVVVDDLSVGSHAVTLTATDSEGAIDTDKVSVEVRKPEPVDPPAVELSVKPPRPDLSFSDVLEIADGEAALLAWETQNEPTECLASGGWSGQKSTAGDTVETEGLSGPADIEFILRCENSGGSDADTVAVNVAAPGDRHAVSNRPDATDKAQVKLFYVVDVDGQNRNRDLSGELENSFRRFQDRFEDQTGRRFRTDSYSDGLDVTFVAVDFSDWSGLSTSDAIREEVKKRGLYDRRSGGGNKALIFHYEGDVSASAKCGIGWGNEAYIWLDSCHLEPSTQGHELVHALFMVDSDAPNADNVGHVTDHDKDLMDASASNDFIVDYNRDDYYNENGLPEDIKNLAESPFLIDRPN